MEQYKQDFIDFMVDCEVLRFGDFVTKSGRRTPFFINTGFYRTGGQLRRLGGYYARAIYEKFGTDFDVLFGPAYKGIPLSVATSMAFSEQYGKEIRYCSNRKEVKDHGDKGILLGGPISDGDKVVIIEDVTTAGTSIRETLPILQAQGDVQVLGMVVSVDRQEVAGHREAISDAGADLAGAPEGARAATRGAEPAETPEGARAATRVAGQGQAKSALQEISESFGMQTTAIVTMAEVVEHLYGREYKGKVVIDDQIKDRIDAYYEIYGAH